MTGEISMLHEHFVGLNLFAIFFYPHATVVSSSQKGSSHSLRGTVLSTSPLKITHFFLKQYLSMSIHYSPSFKLFACLISELCCFVYIPFTTFIDSPAQVWGRRQSTFITCTCVLNVSLNLKQPLLNNCQSSRHDTTLYTNKPYCMANPIFLYQTMSRRAVVHTPHVAFKSSQMLPWLRHNEVTSMRFWALCM